MDMDDDDSMVPTTPVASVNLECSKRAAVGPATPTGAQVAINQQLGPSIGFPFRDDATLGVVGDYFDCYLCHLFGPDRPDLPEKEHLIAGAMCSYQVFQRRRARICSRCHGQQNKSPEGSDKNSEREAAAEQSC